MDRERTPESAVLFKSYYYYIGQGQCQRAMIKGVRAMWWRAMTEEEREYYLIEVKETKREIKERREEIRELRKDLIIYKATLLLRWVKRIKP